MTATAKRTTPKNADSLINTYFNKIKYHLKRSVKSKTAAEDQLISWERESTAIASMARDERYQLVPLTVKLIPLFEKNKHMLNNGCLPMRLANWMAHGIIKPIKQSNGYSFTVVNVRKQLVEMGVEQKYSYYNGRQYVKIMFAMRKVAKMFDMEWNKANAGMVAMSAN